MICVTITLIAKPGNEAAIEALFAEYIPRVHAEGHGRFTAQRSRGDRGKFLIYETYASDEVYEAHRASPLFAHYRPKIAELEEGRIRELYDVVA